MKYISTRGQTEPVSFTEAVATGLAPDGGLFLPEVLPDFSARLKEWETLDYPALCAAFFEAFATDIPAATIRQMVEDSYSRFDHPDIAPLQRLDDRLFVLELFHGPTLAFKDFALQLLGNLYEEQIQRTGIPINVLGATSGDTGSAAIHGLLGKDGVNIFILYPDGRVAPLQERQMACTGADNVFAIAVEGTFDDAQHTLKEVFGDQAFRSEFRLSAVNSINMARILAQSVYYLYGYFRLPEDARSEVEFIVPTGNFGNVLSGWLARKMGLPVKSFKVATNQNDILHRLFSSGIYEVQEVSPSHAPSMDIQVASNFERFLYYAEGSDPQRVREIMQTFRETGRYTFHDFDCDIFNSSRMDDQEIRRKIKQVYERYGYILDPHTACGFRDHDPEKTSVVLATAHPAKFPDVIKDAIGEEPTAPALERLKDRPLDSHPLPADAEAVKAFIRANAVIRSDTLNA